jgi:hypothetical protein
LKIKRSLKAFLDWYDEFKPEVISTEYIVWGKGYAGTVDLKAKIGDKTYVIDFKTSNAIHDSHRAQIAAYGLTEDVDDIALLHLGNTTKKKYSFLVYEGEKKRKYEQQFQAALNMFHTLNPKAKPTDETFPELFTLKK